MVQYATIQSLFEETLKQLYRTIKWVSAYPSDHPSFRRFITKSFQMLGSVLKNRPSFTIMATGGMLMVEDIQISGKDIFSSKFADYLTQKELQSLTFFQGLSLEEFKLFLEILKKDTGSIIEKGGIGSILLKKGVRNISVNKTKYGKITEGLNGTKAASGPGCIGSETDCCLDLDENKDPYWNITENHHDSATDSVRMDSGEDSAGNMDGAKTQTETEAEGLRQIARQLLVREKAGFDQFNEEVTAFLSTMDDEILLHMAQEMGVDEKEKNKAMACLVREFFYYAVAEAYMETYIKENKNDRELLERLIPERGERRKALPYLKKILSEYGRPDDIHLISYDFFDESGSKEPDEAFLHRIKKGDLAQGNQEKGEAEAVSKGSENSGDTNNISGAANNVNDNGMESDVHIGIENKKQTEDIKEKVSELLRQGRADEAQAIINKFSRMLDDKSGDIRKSVAESFQDIISTMNEFDRLKEAFVDISSILIDKIKKEDHVDTYLILTENLKKICSSQEKEGFYLIDETLGNRLYQARKMTKSQLTQVLLARKKNNRSLQYNCAAMNYTDESLLTHFIAEQYKGFPVINLSQIDNIPKNTLDIIPFKYIQHYLVLPFRLEGRKVFTAMANPRNVNVINELQFLVGHTVVPFVAGEYFLINAIDKYYKSEASESDMGQTLEEISQEDELEFIEEKDDDEKTNRIDEIEGVQGPVVKLVNLILKEAIAQKASDVHIEPYENELRVRFRVDGTLITVLNPSPKYKNGISSRIKIMSRLNISERRLPQDGRFKIKMDKKCVDFRVSTFPGSFGEKVVLRLLDKSNLEVDISKLGMDINDQKALSEAMHKSKGMILVTGPTGSGKTTTLYSVLHGLNDGTRNISTAEDPIEYNISGINQFQMNPRIGLDFAKALRAFLRQDPDIIMVGEIRDLETAQIAVKAALTGHLVLSTLHTNSATETITRLLDMNVEPFLVATSISLIIAQRLMRRICPSCKEETSLENMHLEVLEKKGIDISGVRFYKGKGCSNCNYAGYKGRVAIYEVLPIRHELQEMIIKGESSLKIQSKAEEFGLQTLQKRGIEKVMDGTTSVDEWLRVAV